MEQEQLKTFIKGIIVKVIREMPIPVGISNRHLHLTESDYGKLFPNQALTVKKMLKQPGEFAAEQTVTVVGPKGKIERVRILGPFRKQSQVELSLTDARHLGLKVPIRLSGDLAGTPGIKLVSKDGELELPQGAIVAKRHIHMSPAEAKLFGVKNGDDVSVKLNTETRSVIFDHCTIRVKEKMVLEMHIDTDEANAANAGSKTTATIINKCSKVNE
ncbi:phosphate propanoyltransferase [Bacillaceae bacterium Marseille-Q3522]|nr:phosphate propanoyltransferase [Bacillaceae bacterium Marseille-Q3522]